MRSWWVVVGLLLLPAGAAAAPLQPAADDSATLTLRPGKGLSDLAQRVVEALGLRGGPRAEVGAPASARAEGIELGHVTLVRHDGDVLLVFGTATGALDARVPVSTRADAADVRAIAMVLEALFDAALAMPAAEPETTEMVAREVSAPGARSMPGSTPASTPAAARDDGGPWSLRPGDTRRGVSPLVFAEAYSGASSASRAPMFGLATGAGLCVDGQCMLLTAEFPLPVTESDPADVRYRYLTFLTSFYSRPTELALGAFQPGARIGFLTRVGDFRGDMGMGQGGLDTDLGFRGSLEIAWEISESLDLVAGLGADYTIDRWQLSNGISTINRGDRWAPWGQSAIRYRID